MWMQEIDWLLYQIPEKNCGHDQIAQWSAFRINALTNENDELTERSIDK